MGCTSPGACTAVWSDESGYVVDPELYKCVQSFLGPAFDLGIAALRLHTEMLTSIYQLALLFSTKAVRELRVRRMCLLFPLMSLNTVRRSPVRLCVRRWMTVTAGWCQQLRVRV